MTRKIKIEILNLRIISLIVKYLWKEILFKFLLVASGFDSDC